MTDNVDKKTWVVVTIAVAIMGCLGTVVAAAIGILPEITRPDSTTTPSTSIIAISTSALPLAQATAPTHDSPVLTNVLNFSDWQSPSGHDGYVEYRRCPDFPDDNFPVFDADTPGYIHLEPQSARKENGNYTWCFEARSTGYSSNNLTVYFCAPPVSGFCAEPGKVPIPLEAVVSVDHDSCVVSPVMGNRNGVSIRNSRIIRVTLPGDTNQEPTISVGPYPNEGASYIACP